MRREGGDHLAPRGARKFLVEFRHVAMMADPVGMETLRDLREQHVLLGRPARPRHPRLRVDDDVVDRDHAFADQRDERKLCACGVAAGIGDEPRLFDVVAVDLDQTVNRLFLQVGRGMLAAIPARIGGGVGETKIGREVDHFRARRGRKKRGDHFLRGRMRQRAEYEIKPRACPVNAVDRDELRQVERRELREHVAHRLAGPPIGREQRNLDLRVAAREAAPAPSRYSRRRRARRSLLWWPWESCAGVNDERRYRKSASRG